MSPKVHVGLAYFERYLWSLSVMHITISLASNVANELVTGWCIMEWVKRLDGNEIELGIGYQRSNLGQVTYRWQREQCMLLCALTNKDLRRICRNQYEHPGSAIGYWPERCLGHVYIVLEPIGSTRLTFDDDMYYMRLGVPRGKLLGFLVSEQGIDANLGKINTICPN